MRVGGGDAVDRIAEGAEGICKRGGGHVRRGGVIVENGAFGLISLGLDKVVGGACTNWYHCNKVEAERQLVDRDTVSGYAISREGWVGAVARIAGKVKQSGIARSEVGSVDESLSIVDCLGV